MYGTNSPTRSGLLRFLTTAALLAGIGVADADPAWWSDPTGPVINNGPDNNKAVANVGQAKWMAKRAFETLSDRLGSDADVVEAIEAELFKATDTATSGVFFPERPVSPTAEWLATQKAPLQVGVLKALAAPFYRHLSDYDAAWLEDQFEDNELIADADYFTDTDGTLYPWNPANNSDSTINRSVANLGQLKLVFSLDFSTLELPGASFLVRPSANSTHLLEDGVPLGFDVHALNLPGTDLPGRIDISIRSAGTSDPWDHVGRITSFRLRNAVKFVRGGTVWVPDAPGEYEVQAKAYDGTATLLATETRTVSVEGNHAPTILILTGPASPSATPVYPSFETDVDDEDAGDAVQRVEFYDNGVLLATDTTPPFGDNVGVELMKGTHSITAKAYDRYSASSTSSPYGVEITGGESRPTFTITSPSNGSSIAAHTDLVIGLSTSHPDGDSIVEVGYHLKETNITDYDTTGPFTSITIPHAELQDGENTVELTLLDDDGIYSYPLSIKVVRGTYADTLAQEIADGLTAVVSNASYAGRKEASGTFSGGLASGLETGSGTLMTSGRFDSWDNGDGMGSEGTTEQWNLPGDAKLQNRIAGNSTHDAAILEFDVFCSDSQLELELQFSSEEYMEYVAQFNDAFLVTVDNAVMNLVPDGTDIIAVNTVHETKTYDSGGPLDPIDYVPAQREELYIDDDDITGSPKLEYDGTTIKLRLHAFVTPNETHRVRLAIADVNDGALDSGLFLETNSLKTVDPTN